MRCEPLMRAAILFLLTSLSSGCQLDGVGTVTPKAAVKLPVPPAFMGDCGPSAVKLGDMPGVAFDIEHAALKQCRRAGAASRSWYIGVRSRYGAAKLK